MAHSSPHPSHPSTGRQKSTHSASTASLETIQTTSIWIWCAACTTLKYKKPYDSSGPYGQVTLDGAVYGDYDWRHLSENEAEELHDLIDMIDVDAILVASTR